MTARPPILYSLRHCPYAIRARMGILLSKQTVLLRDVVTKNKPAELLIASPKGTVPVLVVDETQVVDESLEIMLWALDQNDPQDLLQNDNPNTLPAMLALIAENDNEYVYNLEKYKLTARHHDSKETHYRQHCEQFITKLEQRLVTHPFFMGLAPTLTDYALLPFIRQFARVNRKWYLQAPYPNVQRWLNAHLQSPLFTKAMAKYPLWLDAREDILFGWK